MPVKKTKPAPKKKAPTKKSAPKKTPAKKAVAKKTAPKKPRTASNAGAQDGSRMFRSRKSKVPSAKVIPSTAKGVVVDMTPESADSDTKE